MKFRRCKRLILLRRIKPLMQIFIPFKEIHLYFLVLASIHQELRHKIPLKLLTGFQFLPSRENRLLRFSVSRFIFILICHIFHRLFTLRGDFLLWYSTGILQRLTSQGNKIGPWSFTVGRHWMAITDMWLWVSFLASFVKHFWFPFHEGGQQTIVGKKMEV